MHYVFIKACKYDEFSKAQLSRVTSPDVHWELRKQKHNLKVHS